ncbi:MAG: hypothetical protein ACON4J_00095, partial [Parvibaculales bacterium]
MGDGQKSNIQNDDIALKENEISKDDQFVTDSHLSNDTEELFSLSETDKAEWAVGVAEYLKNEKTLIDKSLAITEHSINFQLDKANQERILINN